MVRNKIEEYKFDNVFSSSSQRFQSSQCVPQDVPNSITFISHILCPKLSSFSPMYVGQRASTLSFNKNFYFGEPSKVVFFFWFCFWGWANQNGSLKKEKKNLGRLPPSNLIQRLKLNPFRLLTIN
jgi:hypothetical protein